MKPRPAIWIAYLLCVGSLAFAMIPPPAAAAPARLGVYKSNGCTGVQRLPEFVNWFGREPDLILDFFDVRSWKAMVDDSKWTVKCWRNAGHPEVVFSVPMLVRETQDSLADGASGKFDHYFSDIAKLLVDNGYGNAIIRLGWEFNGRDFYPWAAAKDPANFIEYWRRIVTVMRAVPGTRLRFDWCPAQGKQEYAPDKVYPGDEYVDIIGQDVYNQTWTKAVDTPQERWKELMDQPFGLKWQRDFAASHGKPMSFPEWATMARNDGKGGGDDGYFIEQMAAWIAANDVEYHAYWDHASKGYSAKLSDGSKPDAAAAFLKGFRRAQPEPPKLLPFTNSR